MNVKRVKFLSITLALVVGLAMTMAGYLWAGYFYTQNTVVGTSYAYGAMCNARRSSDNVQYIGCASNTSGATYCWARNSVGTFKSCYSTSAAMHNQLHSMTDCSYIYFTVNTAGQCAYIYIRNASYHL